MRLLPFVAILSTIVGMAGSLAPLCLAADANLGQAIAGAWRKPAFVARDAVRHPAEELAFFGLKPNMTVVEVWPGGGYWTEILAPYLHDHGTLYAAGFAAGPGGEESKGRLA